MLEEMERIAQMKYGAGSQSKCVLFNDEDEGDESEGSSEEEDEDEGSEEGEFLAEGEGVGYVEEY